MNRKLLREDYYNDEYKLNEQETLEFITPICDPYWMVRSRAYLLQVPIFGLKSEIQRKIEKLLFKQQNINLSKETNDLKHEEVLNANSNNSILTLPSSFQVKNLIEVDLTEILNKNNDNLNFRENNFLITKNYKKIALSIFSLIPELKIKRKLSYEETFSTLSRLADSKMLFVDVFKNNSSNNLISAIIYLPFNPLLLKKSLIYKNYKFIENLASYLNVSFPKVDNPSLTRINLSTSSEESFEPVPFYLAVAYQKLLDVFYLVEDTESLHGITDCYSKFEDCKEIASLYCENSMCLKCCQKSANKEFCIIHDNLVNSYRKKTKELLLFENSKNFDRTRTIRITLRQRVNIGDIKTIFKDYKINWNLSLEFNENNDNNDDNNNNNSVENIEIFFRKGVEKIQFIYLVLESNEEAKRLYDNRNTIIKEHSKLDLNIMTLLGSFESLVSSEIDLTLSGLLIVPISSQVTSKIVPKKEQRNESFKKLIETTLNITNNDYQIQNSTNLINKQFSYDYYIVSFKNTSFVDKFYQSQPFFGSVIFHKFTHFNILPMLRTVNNNIFCLNDCSQLKNKDCIFEFCSNCCSKINNSYYNNKLKCNDCVNINNNDDVDQNAFDIYEHLLTKFADFSTFDEAYNLRLEEIKILLFECLRNSDFTWYRNVSNTNVSRKMCDMNKELSIVMDNANYKRDGPLKETDKMYKVFTFQNESKKYENKSFENFSTTSGFDNQGSLFVQYNLNANESNVNEYTEYNLQYLESIYSKETKEQLQAVETDYDYHILMYGLDSSKLTLFDLIEDVFTEIRNNGVKMNKEDIKLLDELSLLKFLYSENNNNNSNSNSNSLLNVFENYGRFLVLKFESAKEALKIYCGQIKLNLPILNSKRGEPLMLAGHLLIKFIEEYENKH